MQDSNTSIQVMVHGSDISYNKERLMDLQNKVMLVSNDDIATKEQVQTYQQVGLNILYFFYVIGLRDYSQLNVI